MADGNLGNLWFQLGIKDNTPKTLNEMLLKLNEVEGSVAKMNKEWYQHIGTIKKANKELSDLKKNGLDERSAEVQAVKDIIKQERERANLIKKGVDNALTYQGILQRIAEKTREINNLRNTASKNSDISGLKEASTMLSKLYNQLIAVQQQMSKTGGPHGLGGVDMSTWLPMYRKLISNTFKDVNERAVAFRKSNSLSDLSSRLDQVNKAYEQVKQRLIEINSLRSKDSGKGFNGSYLIAASNALGGVRRRMRDVLEEKKTLDQSGLDKLLSDTSIRLTRAVTQLKEYKAERDKLLREMSKPDERAVKVRWGGLDTGPIDKRLAELREMVTAYNQAAEARKRLSEAEAKASGKGEGSTAAKFIANELRAQIPLLEEAFNKLSSGLGIEKIKNDIAYLESLRNQFVAGNERGTYREYHDQRYLEDQKAREEAEHNNRLNQIKEAFRNQEIERQNAEANKKTAENAQKAIMRLQDDRATNAVNNLNKIEAKERELAELYGRLRSVRDEGRARGVDVSQIEADMEQVRRLYSELNAMRRDVPSGKGFSPIGLSSSELSSVQRHMESTKAATQRVNEELRNAAQTAKDLASSFDRVNKSVSSTSRILGDIKSLFLQGGIVFGAQQFANSVIQTGGDIVQQHIALRSILGDIEKADQMFSQTQQLALQSPFTFQELNRDVKQLAAFGVDTDRLYDTTKRLADVSAGLGVSFERLGLAYGQVKARSWLDGKELRQFAYAGLPMLQKVADLYNQTRKNGRNDYTTSDIRNMITKRQVSFEDVDAVFKRLTDAGGQFYNMQFVLSETLLGRWNKLKDAWSIMLGRMADGKNVIGSVFSTAINGATSLVLAIDKLGPVLAAAFSGYGLHRMMAMIGGNIASGILTAKGNLASRYQEMALGGKKLSDAQRAILATKRMITVEDLKALQTAGSLTTQDIKRLYVARRITTEQYKQLMGTRANVATTSGLSRLWTALWAQMTAMTTRNYWANFGVRAMTAFSLIGNGVKKLGATIWSAIGGLPGLIVTAITMIGVNIWQKHEELQQSISQAMDLGKQKFDDLRQYIENNPIRLKADIGDIAKQIDQEKDTLKEKAGSLYDTIMINAKEGSGVSVNGVQPGGSLANQLRYLREYTILLSNAASDTNKLHGWFAKVIDDTNTINRESLSTNLKDLENSATELQILLPKLNMNALVGDAERIKNTKGFYSDDMKKLAEYVLQANKNGKDLKETLSGLRDVMPKNVSVGEGTGALSLYTRGVKDIIDRSNDLEPQIKEVAQQVSQQFKNLATDPMEQAIYASLKDAWKGANNLDVVQGNYFDMKLDQAVGLKDFPSLAEDVARDAADRMSNRTKEILSNGQPLTKAAKEDINRATKEAMNNLKIMWPGTANEIQKILNSQRFNINVQMHILGSQKIADDYLTNLYLGKTFYGQRKQLSDNANGYFSQWKQGASDEVSFESNARGAVDKAKERVESVKRQKNISSELKTVVQEYQNTRRAFREILGYDYAGSDTGTTSKVNKASQQAQKAKERAEAAARKADNAAMKSLEARLTLIKEAYAMYKQYYDKLHNEQAAIKVVSERFNGQGLSTDDISSLTSEKGLLSLVENYITRVRGTKFRNPEEMKDRKDSAIASGVKEKDTILFRDLTENMDDYTSRMEFDLERMSRRWEMYNSLLKTTGNPQLAASVSGLSADSNSADTGIYGAGSFTTGFVPLYSDYLKNYINSIIFSSHTPSASIDYNRLPNMTDKEIEKYVGSLFADNDKDKVNALVVALKKLKELMVNTEFKDGIEAFNKLMGQIVDSASDIARAETEYTQTILKLENLHDNGKLSDKEYEQAKGVADTNYDTAMLKASDTYKQFMGQVTSMTESAADDMRDKILNNLDEQLSHNIITVDQYIDGLKSVNEQMSALQNSHSNAYSFATGGLQGWANNMKQKGIDLIRTDISNGGGKFWSNGKTTAAGNAMLAKAGKGAGSVAIVDAIINGINDNVQSYKKLEASWTDAFGNGLKNSKFSNFMSGWTEASQGAADGWNSLKNGNFVGMFDGVLRSWTGWASFANAAANKRWQKQAEYLKGFQSTLSQINNTLKGKIVPTNGSKAADYSKEYRENLKRESQEVRKTYRDWSQAHTISRNHRNRMYTNLDYDQINSYLRSIGYTGRSVGGDTIQNLSGEYLEKIKEHYAGMWSQLPDDAKKYLDRLIEIEGEQGEINNSTKDLGKILTDIDTETLQSDYKGLLDNLDSMNEDFADSFEKHLRNAILNTMVANLYKDEIDELVNLSNKVSNTKSGKYVSKNGTIKTHTGGDDSKDIMSEYTPEEYAAIIEKQNELNDKMIKSRNQLRDMYGWSDNSSSTSSSIKGVSEQTADLLASYLNAIRGDTSVIRQQIISYLPKIDITTMAQLQQLGQISQNTLRNAEAAERIEKAVSNMNNILDGARSGTRTLSVKVQ